MQGGRPLCASRRRREVSNAGGRKVSRLGERRTIERSIDQSMITAMDLQWRRMLMPVESWGNKRICQVVTRAVDWAHCINACCERAAVLASMQGRGELGLFDVV